MSALVDLAVVDAPRLDQGPRFGNRKCSRIKMGNAPKLRMLGHWQPEFQELEISNTIIETGTRVRPSMTFASVKILALWVRFEVRNEVKMVPSFLKCFPKVETLYVYSETAGQTPCKINLKFWQEAGVIECVRCHVKHIVFEEFRWKINEMAFLKFIAERAQVLEKMMIVAAFECFPARDTAHAMLRPLSSAKWASEAGKLVLSKSPAAQSSSPGWHFRIASDFSCGDPFDRFRGAT